MKPSRPAGEDALEAQNRYHAEELSKKISKLKSAAYDIEVEAKDHVRLLDDVDTEFESGGGFLTGSLNRMNKMMYTGRSDRRLMCYVVLITVGTIGVSLGKICKAISEIYGESETAFKLQQILV